MVRSAAGKDARAPILNNHDKIFVDFFVLQMLYFPRLFDKKLGCLK
jgi:hypothetical protein